MCVFSAVSLTLFHCSLKILWKMWLLMACVHDVFIPPSLFLLSYLCLLEGHGNGIIFSGISGVPWTWPRWQWTHNVMWIFGVFIALRMWLQTVLCFVCDSWRMSDNRNIIPVLSLLVKQTSAYEHCSWLEYRTEMKPHTFGAKPFVSRHYLMYCMFVQLSALAQKGVFF